MKAGGRKDFGTGHESCLYVEHRARPRVGGIPGNTKVQALKTVWSAFRIDRHSRILYINDADHQVGWTKAW